MIRFRLSRFVRNHSRFTVACAMLPLVLLNGRTFTGCGCNGHFEAICHCHCGNGCGGCCGQGGVRSCCAAKTADDRTSNPATKGNSERAQGHHCRQTAEYVVVLATVAPTLADDASQTSADALVAIDLPPASAATSSVHNRQSDTGPPNDLVVTLHRLVI